MFCVQAAEASLEDLNLDKKETEVEVRTEDTGPDRKMRQETVTYENNKRRVRTRMFDLCSSPGGEGHHRPALRKPPGVLQAEGTSHDHQRGHLARLRPQTR